MTDKEKQERRSLRIEIKARKLIIKKLETAINALQKTADRQKAERQAEREKLLVFKNYDDALDAYGWGIITEDEFDRITAFLESSQEAVDELTAEDIAIKVLLNWKQHMGAEISNIEFEMLPKAEQSRILDQNLEILKRREERRKAREVG